MMPNLLGPFHNLKQIAKDMTKIKSLVFWLNPVHLDSLHPLEVAEDMILHVNHRVWYLSDPKQDQETLVNNILVHIKTSCFYLVMPWVWEAK